jgi:hypothetical protein
MYARLIIGLALMVLAALGPYFGPGRAGIHRRVETDRETAKRAPEQGQGAQQRVDQRLARLLILRIAAGVLGALLIVSSLASLLRGHGRLRPQEAQPVMQH